MKLILTIALWDVSPNLWIRKLRHRGSVSQQMVGLYFKLKYVWPESSYSWPFSHLVFLVLSKCVHLLSTRLTGHLRHCGSCVCEVGGGGSQWRTREFTELSIYRSSHLGVKNSIQPSRKEWKVRKENLAECLLWAGCLNLRVWWAKWCRQHW